MDTSETKPSVAMPAKRSWRRHSAEFKARVIELAGQPNMSVAAVALANGLNANMLRRWVREAEPQGSLPGTAQEDTAAALPAFVQLPLTEGLRSPSTSQPPAPMLPSIDVEIHRGGTTVHASLPLDARSAVWLREVLG